MGSTAESLRLTLGDIKFSKTKFKLNDIMDIFNHNTPQQSEYRAHTGIDDILDILYGRT